MICTGFTLGSSIIKILGLASAGRWGGSEVAWIARDAVVLSLEAGNTFIRARSTSLAVYSCFEISEFAIAKSSVLDSIDGAVGLTTRAF